MVKLVYCLHRKPGMSREAFQKRWLEDHGPLVRRLRAQMPTMKRYVQSHTLGGPVEQGMRESRGAAEPYDGITEVWFEDLEGVAGDGGEAALDGARQLLEDEREFLDLPRCSVFLTVEHEIF